MKWQIKKIVMTNFKRVFARSSLENSTVLIKHLKTKFDENGLKGILRLQGVETSAQTRKVNVNVGENFLKNKLDGLVKWYEQFTGLDEVRLMQNRVVEAQNRLVVAQESRREATKSLVAVQEKLKDVRAELDTTTKGEERYLNLITQEHAILKDEKNLNIKFQLCEKEERDCFSFLSAAVKESHEKERAQAERTKYWSVIGSIIGTMIGVLGSSINNEFKMRELRNLVKLSVEDRSEKVLKMREKELLLLVNEIRNATNPKVSGGDQVINEEILLHSVNNYQRDSRIEEIFEQQKQEMKSTLVNFTVVIITVTIMCAVVQRLT